MSVRDAITDSGQNAAKQESGAVWTLRKILDLAESVEGDDSFARAAGALAEIADLAEGAIEAAS